MTKAFIPLALLLASVLSTFSTAHEPAGFPNVECEDPSEWDTHDYLGVHPLFGVLVRHDGSLEDCTGTSGLPDTDGHAEFARGGATLSVASGDGINSGSIACLGETAHHPLQGLVRIEDAVFGAQVPFIVASDTVNLGPPTVPECGDYLAELSISCFGSCIVPFGPGPNGGYDVYTQLPAVRGHIIS